MRSRLFEPATAQFDPDQIVEIAMRNQRGLAIRGRAADENFGGLHSAALGADTVAKTGGTTRIMSSRCRIAIVGGGLAGVATANALKTFGLKAQLYEAAPAFRNNLLSSSHL